MSLKIDGEFTVAHAAAWKTRLLAALQEGAVLELDLSGVAEIDSAGVQLLLATRRAALRRGGELRLVGHSEAVVELFELMGLAPLFGDPVVPALG